MELLLEAETRLGVWESGMDSRYQESILKQMKSETVMIIGL